MKKSKNRFFRHRKPTYPNFFHSINLSMDKVYDTKNNFCLAFPYRKIGRKKGSKKVIFWKKIFFGKTQKHMVFILEKVKLGVGLYFSGALLIWDVWDMVEKNTQSLWPKFRFSPIAPYCTSTRLRITQNLVEDSFLYILYNFEVKRTLFAQAGNIIPRWWFLPKKSIIDLSSPIKMASIIRLVWKFASMLRLSRAFKIAMKLDDRRRSLFDLPDF